MTTESSRFQIEPDGFFDSNPALDGAQSVAGATSGAPLSAARDDNRVSSLPDAAAGARRGKKGRANPVQQSERIVKAIEYFAKGPAG